MRPCPEFYGSDARRTPAAAPQLLTRLCRTRLDQRSRAARASRARLPRRNARGSVDSHRARFSLARRAPAVRTPFVAGVEAHLALRAKRERPIAALRFTSSSIPRVSCAAAQTLATARNAKARAERISLVDQRATADVDNRRRRDLFESLQGAAREEHPRPSRPKARATAPPIEPPPP
jgi:hypothetical protein